MNKFHYLKGSFKQKYFLVIFFFWEALYTIHTNYVQKNRMMII